MTAYSPSSVDNAARPTADERARQRTISVMRRKVLVDLAADMQRTYQDVVAPNVARKTGQEPQDPVAVRRSLDSTMIYKFYSSARYKLQEMTWESVRPQIERNLDTLVEMAREVADSGGGTLRLDPSLEIPRYVSEMDVHLMPGCFHSEYREDDVAQGARYSYGVGVFYGGLPMTTKGGGPGATIAHFLRDAYPAFKPDVIVDLGCTTGDNSFPYVDVFPEAQVHGIDIGAPLLRYGHARAAAAGKVVHFSQQNAEHMDFADNSVDVVTSSFLLHEIPVKSTKAIFAECYRILKPGGIMIHFELPPRAEVDPYRDFYLDWDAYYNNEPNYSQFRRQSLVELCAGAGFERDKYTQQQLFNWGTVSEAEFAACARGEVKAPILLNGGSWFTFGAWK